MVACPKGQYCETYGLVTPIGPCKEGYFCNGSAVVRDPVECSKGHYCPIGTQTELACQPGTFSSKYRNQRYSKY